METSETPGLFYEWLVEGQLEPAFRKYRYLQGAHVLGIPARWSLDKGRWSTESIRLMIFYTQDDYFRLSDVISSHTHGTQNPSLPEGVGNHDLFQEVGTIGPGSVPAPVKFCPASFFVGGEIDVENDDGGVLAAFFVYATFRRDGDGVTCVRRDDRMGARMHRFFAEVIRGRLT